MKGDTIVGISEGYPNRLPKLPKRGPPKKPLEAQVKSQDAEIRMLRQELGNVRNDFCAMQANFQQLMAVLSKQSGAPQEGAQPPIPPAPPAPEVPANEETPEAPDASGRRGRPRTHG